MLMDKIELNNNKTENLQINELKNWDRLGRVWDGAGWCGVVQEMIGRLWEMIGRLWEMIGRLWEMIGRLWERVRKSCDNTGKVLGLGEVGRAP
jgi:hypothetical protein